MNDVSTLRLNLMRAAYLLLVVGLAFDQWPGLIQRSSSWDLWHGVGSSLLATVCLLAVLGLRYPLKMLPLLLFELVWKSIWLLRIALPRWQSHTLTPGMVDTIHACLMGLIFPLVIPWGYFWANYVKALGDRWR